MKAARRKQRLGWLLGLAPADVADAVSDIGGPIPSDELERRQEIAHVYSERRLLVVAGFGAER